ncbi:MAG: HAD hydrolase-like protein [Promethearchaeota archaeon]|jgi:phosphoglycolate phosphatase-like HAD superfamily hydrolase
MTVTVFFDDGGVLNDNSVRGKQWEKFVGEYYSSRFGGELEVWGEANGKIISSFFDMLMVGKDKFGDYQTFYTNFKKHMVLEMFNEAGKILPKNTNPVEVFNSTREYVIPKVQSAIPGVIDSIKRLSSKDFILYTAAGAVSIEMKLYLEGMGVKQHFKEFYGPDLINAWKINSEYYDAIFKHSKVDRAKAIIIEDNPQFLNDALEVGANVIQACITGEHKPQFPFFVTNMRDLVPTIENLLKSINL